MKTRLKESFDYFYANYDRIIDYWSRITLNVITLMILSLIIRNLFFSTL